MRERWFATAHSHSDQHLLLEVRKLVSMQVSIWRILVLADWLEWRTTRGMIDIEQKFARHHKSISHEHIHPFAVL